MCHHLLMTLSDGSSLCTNEAIATCRLTSVSHRLSPSRSDIAGFDRCSEREFLA